MKKEFELLPSPTKNDQFCVRCGKPLLLRFEATSANPQSGEVYMYEAILYCPISETNNQNAKLHSRISYKVFPEQKQEYEDGQKPLRLLP